MAELPPPDEVRVLDTRHIGRRLCIYARLDSTNTQALALAGDPAHDGLALLARSQSAGRGQHGRSWQAAPGRGVLLSVLLFPSPVLRRPALMTSWAAVSVTDTVCALTGREPRIKWPNDVLLGGKKICGILIEQRDGAVVTGIGLNVTQTAAELQQAGLTLAGSIASQTGSLLRADDVAVALLRRLDDHYARMLRHELGEIEERWRAALGLVGQAVVVAGLQHSYRGRLVALTLDAVRVELESGQTCVMAPESIRHITLDGTTCP